MEASYGHYTVRYAEKYNYTPSRLGQQKARCEGRRVCGPLIAMCRWMEAILGVPMSE